MAGDRYVPADAERASWATFEMWVNTQRKKGAGVIRVIRPWAGTRPTYSQDAVEPDAESIERRKKLAAMF